MQRLEDLAWGLLALRRVWRRCELAVAAECERIASELRGG